MCVTQRAGQLPKEWKKVLSSDKNITPLLLQWERRENLSVVNSESNLHYGDDAEFFLLRTSQ